MLNGQSVIPLPPPVLTPNCLEKSGTAFNYHSAWKWSSCGERWQETKAARRRRAPRWGRRRRPRPWCWSWSWGALARTPGPRGGSAPGRCRWRRSGRSGGFLSRWLEASLERERGGKETTRRSWWVHERRSSGGDEMIEDAAGSGGGGWESYKRRRNNPFISFQGRFSSRFMCWSEKMRRRRQRNNRGRKMFCLPSGWKCRDNIRSGAAKQNRRTEWKDT